MEGRGAGPAGEVEEPGARGGKMRPCVVFDLDDTLYLERDYVFSGFASVGEWVREQWGDERFAETAWRHFLAGVRGTIFDATLEDLGLPREPEVISTLVRVYREHPPRIALLPDAAECLRRLSGRAFLGVITDGPPVCQRAKACALGLRQRVARVIYTSELGDGYGKPHPRAFEEMQVSAGVSGAACIYIADNPHKDFLAPKQLGWGTVRVVRDGGLYSIVQGTREQEAANVVHDLWGITDSILGSAEKDR